MSKITGLSALALLLLICGSIYSFQGCLKENPTDENQPTQFSLAQMVADYNYGKNMDFEKALLLKGTVTAMTFPSNEVLFFIEYPGQSSQDLFYGQGTSLSSTLGKEMKEVTVAYFRDALAVETKEGELFTYSLGEGEGHNLIKDLPAVWKGTGYGLSYRTNTPFRPKDVKGLSSLEIVREVTCICIEFYVQEECDSGGPGAVTCSISDSSGECSVTCREQYYPCCNSDEN